MFEDTLWIYTAIAGSIVGAIALAYLKDTRAGIWFYGKVDQTLGVQKTLHESRSRIRTKRN